MSLYKFIGAEHPLPEADFSGIIKIKVKDLKQLKNVPQGPWNEMDDESEVLYAEDESAFGALYISLCTNPPYGLEDYIDKKFIYWLNGRINLKNTQQLYKYIKEQVPEGTPIELWSIWFGDGIQEIQSRKLTQKELTVMDLEFLDQENCCLQIE